MNSIFFFAAAVFLIPSISWAGKECYAIDRTGKVIVLRDKNYDECMVESRKVRANLYPDKSVLGMGWGDSSKVDAKNVLAEKLPAAVKKSNVSSCLKESRAVANIIPGTEGRTDGLRLVSVMKESAWERANLQSMDLIVTVNDREIKGAKDFDAFFKPGPNIVKYRRGESALLSTTVVCPADVQ